MQAENKENEFIPKVFVGTMRLLECTVCDCPDILNVK